MKSFFIILFISFNLYAQEETLDIIEVTHQGTLSSLVDFVPSVTTLKSNELKKRRESTLGDTLKNEAGVQSSSFGPNASRPVIRGLDGDRIRILQNGLGVLDASAQSVDHAVPVDTLVIDSIEVVRGPMSLLYGSSAVGGVVNINTTRIHSTFEKGAIQELQLSGDSSQDALATGAKIDYGTSNKWMLHFDGGYRNANDLKIPGPEASDRATPAQQAEHDGKDRLTNSASVQKTAAVGVSKILNRGFVGMSFYTFDNQYGAVAEKNVDIRMKQDRLELHGEYLVRGEILKSIKFKTAQSDYGHKEIDAGETGTTFTNEGNESRLEFMTQTENVKGISGLQSQLFNFSAVGEEAFLPPSQNRGVSAFTLHDLTSGQDIYSFGGRLETTYLEDQSSGGVSRSFNGINGSLGYRRNFSETHMGIASFSYTERLPSFQELFAEGPHVATGTYEKGNDGLRKERAFALDLGLKYKSDSVQAGLNLYAQEFKDYVTLFLTDTPSPTDPAVNESEYRQVDALFYGFELDGKKKLGNSPLSIITKADLVLAKNKDSGDNLPRISPPRLTLGVEMLKDRWLWDAEAQYHFEQHHIADTEKRTDSFTLLNAGFSFDLIKHAGKWSFFGRLKNILNQEARLHTSTLKEIAPMAGRNIVAGIQCTY
jgi:iron complex outermembrane receptor protein